MAKEVKTIDKRLKNLKTGIGKKFTADDQPSPEAKSKGWQERRAERLLTQKIFERMTKGKTLDEYIDTLLRLVNDEGNTKAIDTINKGIEEQVIKTEVSVTKGANGILIEDE